MELRSGTCTMASIIRVFLLMVAIFQNVSGQSCGGNLTGSGRITSPNYPGNYPNSANCQWTLTADEATGSSISLFIEELRTEEHYDVVEIYSEGIFLTRYQGLTAAHKSVFGRRITVVFRADDSGTEKGFSIIFNSTGPECGTSCSNTGCSFWTPNFPYPYPKGSHCVWNISNNGGLIAFEPTALSATPFTGELRITSPFSGVPTTFTFRSPALMPIAMILERFVAVNFTSDRCRSGQGFLLSLERKGARCGTLLVGQGTFSTPNYPSSYPVDMICMWQLIALAGRRVQLTMTDLRVENFFDYVRVYSDNRFVNSYTGNHSSFTLTLGTIVYIEFQSDAFVSMNGLSASFISV